jgi:hypothetical protein
LGDQREFKMKRNRKDEGSGHGTGPHQVGDFIDQVVARRTSKEGRFLRVWFKGGGQVDLVPDGSLASGLLLVNKPGKSDPWNLVNPDLDGLQAEFMASTMQG